MIKQITREEVPAALRDFARTEMAEYPDAVIGLNMGADAIEMVDRARRILATYGEPGSMFRDLCSCLMEGEDGD